METKSPLLLKMTWYISLIMSIIGWGMFLIWAMGRYLFASSLFDFELTMFLWLVIAFFLFVHVFLFYWVYVVTNLKRLDKKVVYTGILVSCYVGSICLIPDLQSKVSDRVFVSITNKTNFEQIDLQLQGKYKTWEIGVVNQDGSNVFNYAPPYLYGDARKYMNPDTLFLLMRHDQTLDSIAFPNYALGTCVHLTINEQLKLIEKRN